MTSISLSYLTPKGNQTDIITLGFITCDMIQSHTKITKKKLMHGSSKWFHKKYIMIIQGGLKNI